jgi:GT2 family glycosyltransferase
MKTETKKTAIVILNWNGWQDTIECLHSLLEMNTQNFCVFIIDNNSSDESIKRISSFISEYHLQSRFFVFPQPENLGFAKGSNVGIKYALKNDFEFIWLLNNDTIVEKNTLDELLLFFYNYSAYSITTPCINYYSDRNKIWNCGGKISQLGYRKYFFAEKQESILPNKKYVTITFVTNCASFFRKSYFENNGLLTEKFFFGEEDFEMCLRAKKDKIKISCVLTTKIYHKVSKSITKISSSDHLGKSYIHYLNRFVNMKLYFGAMPIFYIFVIVYTPYVFILLLLKHKHNPIKIIYLLFNVIKKSVILNSVNKEEFQKVLDK